MIFLKRGLFSEEGKIVFFNSKNQPIFFLISVTFVNLILLSPSQTGIKRYDNTAFTILKTFISPPHQNESSITSNISNDITQLKFTCSSSTIETLKKGAKYIQS